MLCPRCKGIMIVERFRDLKDGSGEIDFQGLRCLTCGEVLDPVIAMNRARRPATGTRRRLKLVRA